MKTPEQYSIEELATQSRFEQLSSTEQAFVLQHVDSAERFNELHETITKAKDILKDERNVESMGAKAPHSLHLVLQRTRYGVVQSERKPWWQMPIPLYQSVVSAAACVLIAVLLYKPSSVSFPTVERNQDTVRTIVYQVLNRDSLALLIADSIRIALLERDSRALFVGVRKKRREVSTSVGIQQSTSTTMASSVPIAANRYVGLANLPAVFEQKRGKSQGDEPALSTLTLPLVR